MSCATIVFRTDASLDIGTGHVMRCLTLADALRKHGASCRFVCRAHPGNLLDVIRQQGFEAHALPIAVEQPRRQDTLAKLRPTYAPWLGADWTVDLQQTLDVLGDRSVEWLVVDHYALDARWERGLRSACRHLMVIDDLADRPHECDLLLDQNLGRTRAEYANLVQAGCKVLASPKYALLRPEFAALRPYSLARSESSHVRHLLITLGGVDKSNLTTSVLDGLMDCPLPSDCHITVVMGPHAPWLEHVRDRVERMPWVTELKVNACNMAKLMADSDLAIGAAGTTAWERCCLALPTLTAVLADNQQEGASALQAAGAVLLLGNRIPVARELRAKLPLLLAPNTRAKMRKACQSITDGAGTGRLVMELNHALL